MFYSQILKYIDNFTQNPEVKLHLYTTGRVISPTSDEYDVLSESSRTHLLPSRQRKESERFSEVCSTSKLLWAYIELHSIIIRFYTSFALSWDFLVLKNLIIKYDNYFKEHFLV